PAGTQRRFVVGGDRLGDRRVQRRPGNDKSGDHCRQTKLLCAQGRQSLRLQNKRYSTRRGCVRADEQEPGRQDHNTGGCSQNPFHALGETHMTVLDSRKLLMISGLLLVTTLAVLGASSKETAVVRDLSVNSKDDFVEVKIAANERVQYTY